MWPPQHHSPEAFVFHQYLSPDVFAHIRHHIRQWCVAQHLLSDQMIIWLCQVTIIILECCHSIYFYSILSCIIKTAFHFYLFYTPGSYSHILLNVQIAKTIHITSIILNQTSRITDRTRTLNLKLCDRIRQSKGLCLEKQN